MAARHGSAIAAPASFRETRLQAAMVLVLATAAQGFEEITVAVSTDPVGCFYYGMKFSPSTNETAHKVSDMYKCQELCHQTAGCAYFGFRSEWSGCWLAHANATAVGDPYFVAGPPACGAGAADVCAELPSGTFPGATRAESHAAFPSGFQPPYLECWPRDIHGWLAECKDVKVMDDAPKTTWAAACSDMQLVNLDVGDTCANSCQRSIRCSAYQEVQTMGLTQCYQGIGTKCWTVRPVPGATVVDGGRIQHGTYRALKKLDGYQLKGLVRAWGPERFGTDTIARANALSQPAVQSAIKECKAVCLSYVMCEAWQLSLQLGCFYMDPEVRPLEFPLTTKTLRNTSIGAPFFVDGELLQRMCRDAAPGVEEMPSAVDGPEILEPIDMPPPPPLAPAPPAPTTAAPTTPEPATSTAPPEPAAPTAETTLPLSTGVLPSGAKRFVSSQWGTLYFEATGTGTKHIVRMGKDGCAVCVPTPPDCAAPLVLDQAYLGSLPTGEDFHCEMLVSGSLDRGMGLTWTTTTVSTTTTLTTTSAIFLLVGRAGGGQTGGGGWGWGWAVLLLCLIPCCIFAAVFLVAVKRRNDKRRAKGDFGSEEESEDGDLAQLPLAQYGDYGMPPSPQSLHDPSVYGIMPQPMGIPFPNAGPQMGYGMPPMGQPGYGMPAGQEQQYDLVTVTPNGLEVTPLDTPPPMLPGQGPPPPMAPPMGAYGDYGAGAPPSSGFGPGLGGVPPVAGQPAYY